MHLGDSRRSCRRPTTIATERAPSPCGRTSCVKNARPAAPEPGSCSAARGLLVVNVLVLAGLRQDRPAAADAGRPWRRLPAAVIVGDLATDNDARRLARPGRRRCRSRPATSATSKRRWWPGRARQLDLDGRATAVHRERRQPRLPGLLRPGRDLRVVLLSVTEGEDKPLKYPTIFKTADVVRGEQDRPGRGRPASTRAAALANVRRHRPAGDDLRAVGPDRRGDGPAGMRYLEGPASAMRPTARDMSGSRPCDPRPR